MAWPNKFISQIISALKKFETKQMSVIMLTISTAKLSVGKTLKCHETIECVKLMSRMNQQTDIFFLLICPLYANEG